jgi:hypothetical protein
LPIESETVLTLSLQEVPVTALSLPEWTDPRVQVWQTSGGAVSAYGYSDGRTHWLYLPDLAVFSFQHDSREVKTFALRPYQDNIIHDVYYRTVLPLALQALGTEVLHASAVRTQQGVVAFCAASGTGKSTLACALNIRGYASWADDAVAFALTSEQVVGFLLPFSVHLRPESETFFDRNLHRRGGQEPVDNHGALRPESVRLAAVFVLQRSAAKGEQGKIEAQRFTPALALPATLAHAYCFSLDDQERKRRMLESYFALVSQVPVFELRFPSCLDQLPQVVRCIEETLQNL